ncbi:uncharacterized protein AFUA_8G00270 [Aspergillus fumigatus Af293]|uniref:Polyketide synthase n=1 Tax=Aspergillus fumigatus (strain ATCC MYA-4609 / CBS 101355 / FGSC A1100 / Af293) TaxID=330879 RepID=Q4WAX3_ASPFU|nr:conserved hypothetical protein [Aspergillus fumigatus Af293]EAL85139.2 conserved hypothetical protein [Aspergillus fumigatus Af293]
MAADSLSPTKIRPDAMTNTGESGPLLQWSLDLVSPEDELAREQAQPRFTWDMRDPPWARSMNGPIFCSLTGPTMTRSIHPSTFPTIFDIDNRSVLVEGIRTPLQEKDCRWVILAHDFSPSSQEVWRRLPAHSVFVLNETLLDSAPDPEKTLHTATVSDALQLALDLVQKYPGLTKSVASVHDISAFVGVVTYRYHDSRLRVSSILLISAEDFELDGPSVASYGLDSIIGAEMKNWSFKEVGLEFSFQNLLSPSLTFGGLAEVVSMHLGVIPATD